MKRLLILTGFTLAFLPCATPAQDRGQDPDLTKDTPRVPPKPVLVLETWRGTLNDSAPRDLAPRNNVVVDQKQWADLWTAWRGNEPLPRVDFTREVLLVRTAPGRKGFTEVTWLKDEVGNLTCREKVELDGLPGFTYVVQRIPRAGVRKINGSFLQE